MPELPEVETIKKGLEKYLVGHKIIDVQVNNAKIFSGDVKSIIGGKIKSIRRFAKVLSIDLSNQTSLVIHIKMTGQIIYRGPNLASPPALSHKILGLPGKHTHVIFKLDKGGYLYYNDVRRFGWIKVLKADEVNKLDFIRKLGPEPFAALTLGKFKEIIKKYKTPIKALLMDQTKIGGIGNIYANDALWLAKIHPKKSASSLSMSEANMLYESVLKVLKEGILRGGASELAFVNADGGEGNYQKFFLAYGQQGKLCSKCHKTKIQKVFLAGRGTYFCPNCQRYG